MRNAAQDALSRRQLELERQLIAQGMDPREAEMAAARGVMMGDNASRAVRADRAVAEYEDATGMSLGNGADLDNLDGAAADLVVEDILGGPLSRPSVPQSERVFKDDPTGGLAAMVAAREAANPTEPTPMGTRVPGPVDLGTGQSEAGEPMFSEEEVAAYELRQPAGNEAQRAAAQLMGGGPYRGGDFMPSQEDEDMYRRGMVYTINPQTGEGGYSVAYPQMNEAGTPGAPGRLGTRTDLMGKVRDAATGGYLPQTQKYDMAVRASPLGKVEVYAPTDDFRRELAARDLLRRRQRLAERAGLTGAEGEPNLADLDLNQLRALGDSRLAADRAARQQALQRTRMAQTNPLEYMNRGDVSDWGQMVMSDRMLRRGYRGATPLDVDEATQQALALQESRRAITEGLRPQTPAQTKAADALAEAKAREVTPPELLAREAVGRGDFQHPDVYKVANDMVNRLFSSVTPLGNTSKFTDEEVAEAAGLLSQDYNIPPDQAAAIMRRIQAERARNMVASSIVASFFD